VTRETDDPDADAREALVRLTWKNSTETPDGGSSVMERETGTVSADWDEVEVVEVELQPVRNENIMAEANRSNKILRISCLLDVREDVRNLVMRHTPTCFWLTACG
jgi:hypothetical protein